MEIPAAGKALPVAFMLSAHLALNLPVASNKAVVLAALVFPSRKPNRTNPAGICPQQSGEALRKAPASNSASLTEAKSS